MKFGEDVSVPARELIFPILRDYLNNASKKRQDNGADDAGVDASTSKKRRQGGGLGVARVPSSRPPLNEAPLICYQFDDRWWTGLTMSTDGPVEWVRVQVRKRHC